MSETEKVVPTITIRVIDKENFIVEASLEGIIGPDYALAMVDTARRGILDTREDQKSLEFGKKMAALQQAASAMRKPKLV